MTSGYTVGKQYAGGDSAGLGDILLGNTGWVVSFILQVLCCIPHTSILLKIRYSPSHGNRLLQW